jgi:hypothetical protein
MFSGAKIKFTRVSCYARIGSGFEGTLKTEVLQPGAPNEEPKAMEPASAVGSSMRVFQKAIGGDTSRFTLKLGKVGARGLASIQRGGILDFFLIFQFQVSW